MSYPIYYLKFQYDVYNLTISKVSWIRHRDLHLLTVGRFTYTSDQRFVSIHNPMTEDWTLQVRYPQRRDSGVYECQVGTTPPMGHTMVLSVVDGQSSGPHGFSGLIGKALADCHKQTPTKFEPIISPVEVLFPDLNKVDLSMDQKYLYDICKIVTKGESPPGFGDRSPGKLNHARWVTTANRVLRLYIASSSPSDQLKDLAKYVALVYAPSWFTIKCNHKLKDGSSNLWKMLDFSSYMSHEQKKVIHKCIQNNAYFAHPENMLVAMLSDDRNTFVSLRSDEY
ncbi:unnamed protein product [Diabrotica balteata]|uniref:Uncharacterized protein n=1 Tax=Diabrotica balteata TaxID=107213 RepID=A0A9N9T1C4_DIABA|nr:unnamed protein product [Diabrotica balteata]